MAETVRITPDHIPGNQAKVYKLGLRQVGSPSSLLSSSLSRTRHPPYQPHRSFGLRLKMSLIIRLLLLALAVPFVLANGRGCGNGQFKYVFSVAGKGRVLTCDLDGIVKTSAFPTEAQTILPVHPQVKTAPTAGRGIMDWAVALLTSQPTTPLPLSAATTGSGPTALTAAILPRPTPLPLTHPLHLVNPESLLVMMMTSLAMGAGTNAFPPRNASTALVTSPLALKASLLALFPA